MKDIDPTLEELISAWCAGALPSNEGESLRDRVVTDAGCMAAYRSFLAAQFAEVWVPGGDPLLDTKPDSPWFVAPLPHLGPGDAVEAYRDGLGTTWHWPAAAPVRADPRADHVDLAGDATTGPVRVRLRHALLSLLDEAWRARCAARAVATREVENPERVALMVKAIGDALTSASWSGYLHRAARAFDDGSEPGLDERRATALALETRLWLDEAAGATLSSAVVEEAARIDRTLASCETALFALEPREYASVVHGRVLDKGAWWGERARLDEEVTEDLLDAAADTLRREQPKATPRIAAGVLDGLRNWLRPAHGTGAPPFVAAAPVVARIGGPAAPLALVASGGDASSDAVAALTRLASAEPGHRRSALDEALRTLHALPCPWLRPDVRRAVTSASELVDTTEADVLRTALGPRPGAVPIVVASPSAPEGHVLELRIDANRAQARGAAWSKAKQIQAGAQRAVLDAFLVAALRTGTALPMYEFGQHSFTLIRPVDLVDFTVDGDSLALPAAMAFASLWTDTPLPDDLVASARGDGTERIGPVGHVEKKAAAAREAGGSKCRFVLHRDSIAAAADAGLEVIGVETWDDGLREANLLDRLRALAPVAGGSIEVRKRLAALVSDAEQQRLEDFEDSAGRVDAWRALADTVRLLVGWLEKNDKQFSRSDARLAARCHGALAYTYAGDPFSANALLESIALADLPAQWAALRDVVALTSAISDANWATARRVRDDLEPHLDDDIIDVRGLALGTLGREALHRPDRDLSRALELLHAALAHHLEHIPREAPRSRCYLGNALRIAGRLEEAAEQIVKGLAEVDKVARESESYAVSTGMFLRYEHARVLLDVGQASLAAEEALATLDLGRTHGWRPHIGALRTLAWALRAGGQNEECERVLESLAAVAAGSQRDLDRRMLAEAQGPYRRDGEAF